MENEKILTIKIDGADKVLKSTEQIQLELANADKILKKMGIPNASVQTIKKFNKELSNVVDMAKLGEKEMDDLAKAINRAAKEQDKLEGGGGNAGSSVIGKGGRFKSLQGIVSNLAMAGGAAGVAVAAVAAGAVAAYEGMANLTAEIEATNAAALELFNNSAEAEDFAEQVRVLSETFGGTSEEIIQQTKDIAEAEEITHQEALKRIKEKQIANEIAEGKTRDEIEATLRVNKKLIDAQNELANEFNKLNDINTSGIKLALTEMGASILQTFNETSESFSGLNDMFSELTGGFSILDVAVSFTTGLIEVMMKPVQLLADGLKWLLGILNDFKNSDWFQSISDGFSSVVDTFRDVVGSVTDLVDTSTEAKVREGGEILAKKFVERYGEVLGDGLTIETSIAIGKAGYEAAFEAFKQGKSIAESLAAGLKASDAYAKELERKAKELERLRGAEKEYEDSKKKAEDEAAKKAKERGKAEKEIQDKLSESLKEMNDELDKEIAKLAELSRTGSLNEIAKQQQYVLDLQKKQNAAIDDAVRKTRNYTNVTKELQDARKNVEQRGKNTALTADLSAAETKLNQLKTEQSAGIQEIFEVLNTNLTTVWANISKRNAEVISQIEQSAFGLKDGKQTLNLINKGSTQYRTIEEVKARLQELRDNFGDTQDFIDAAISEGFDLPLYNAYTSLINKTKNQIEEYKTQIQATQSSANKAVDESLTAIQERFKEAGIAASEAFYAALNYTDEKLAQAGLKTMQDQIEKLIANRNIDVSDLLGDAMKSVEDFNKLFEQQFGKTVASIQDETLVLDEDLIAQQRALLTGDDLTAFENILASVRRSFDVHNRQVQATNELFRIDELNAISDYNDEWIKYYEERNRLEIREQKLTIDELSFANKDYFNDAIALLEKYRKDRVKAGKKLSNEDIDVIRRNKEASLSLLEQQQREELELFDIQTEENIEALVKKHQEEQGITEDQARTLTEVQIREANLARKQLVAAQEETYKQQGEAFDKFLDESTTKTTDLAKQNVNVFLDLFNQFNDLAKLLVDIAIQQQQNLVDSLQENISKLDQQIADSQAKLSELEDDLAGKQSGRRDAILRGIELEKQRERELTEQKLKQQRELEKAEKKLANQRKAAAITQAVINGALAITNIWASVPKADWGVATGILTGISAATTAAQIALIASQKFAKGGFTGKGDGQRDETGFKVAGVVHQDEWVAPKWMVESPKYGGMINELESVRQKGFAEGGFTSKPDFAGMNDSLSNSFMMSQIQRSVDAAIMLSERPIIANVTEFDNVSANKYRRMSANRL